MSIPHHCPLHSKFPVGSWWFSRAAPSSMYYSNPVVQWLWLEWLPERASSTGRDIPGTDWYLCKVALIHSFYLLLMDMRNQEDRRLHINLDREVHYCKSTIEYLQIRGAQTDLILLRLILNLFFPHPAPHSLQELGQDISYTLSQSEIKMYSWVSSASWWYWIPIQGFHIDGRGEMVKFWVWSLAHEPDLSRMLVLIFQEC